MRQLFTWRFVAAIAALAGLALFVNAVFASDDDLAAVVAPEVEPRRVDLIASVASVDTSDDFAVRFDGTTVGFIDFTFTDDRVMRAAPGTAADIDCDITVARGSRCAVFADLLGEAVIWFGLRERVDDERVELPAIVDLQDGYAVFENGWEIGYPPVIERSCRDEDIVSFGDFLRRFGDDSISTIDIETEQVVAARCAGTDAPVVTTTLPPVDLPEPGLDPGVDPAVDDGVVIDENVGTTITE